MTLNHRGQPTGARPWMHGVEDMRSSARRGMARQAFTGRNVSEEEAAQMQDQYGTVPLTGGDPEGAGDAADQWLRDHEVSSEVAGNMGRGY